MDQPGKVANPARVVSWTGKINIFSLSPLFAPDNFVSRDGFDPSRPASACSFSILRLNHASREG